MFINVSQTLKYNSELEGHYKMSKRTSNLSMFFINSNLSILSQSFPFGPLNTSQKLKVFWFSLMCFNKTEAATRGVLWKKVYLEISHNPHKNTCARASFSEFSFFQRLWYRCFPVNFVKFLRTTFLQNISGRLLLTKPTFCIYCSHTLHG